MYYNFKINLLIGPRTDIERLDHDFGLISSIEVVINTYGVSHRAYQKIYRFYQGLFKQIAYVCRNYYRRTDCVEWQTYDIGNELLRLINARHQAMNLDIILGDLNMHKVFADDQLMLIRHVRRFDLQEAIEEPNLHLWLPVRANSMPNIEQRKRSDPQIAALLRKHTLITKLKLPSYSLYKKLTVNVVRHGPQAIEEVDLLAVYHLIEDSKLTAVDKEFAMDILDGYIRRCQEFKVRRIHAMEKLMTTSGYNGLQTIKGYLMEEILRRIRTWFFQFFKIKENRLLVWPKIMRNALFVLAADQTVREYYDDIFHEDDININREHIMIKRDVPMPENAPPLKQMLMRQIRCGRIRNIRQIMLPSKRTKRFYYGVADPFSANEHEVPFFDILTEYYNGCEHVSTFVKLFEASDGSASIEDKVLEVRNVIFEYYSLMMDFSMNGSRMDYLVNSPWRDVLLHPLWNIYKPQLH